ncbi:hypothetical protein [Streptomyces sp. NPDC088748]|uniref:ABC transporter permease subunit n=1 Tax=Streptomyces sp. NPDC088748 TaxID=3365887 RepID=UPI0037FCE3B4
MSTTTSPPPPPTPNTSRSTSTGRYMRSRATVAAVLLGLTLAPFLLGPYAVATLSRILMFALLALSVNLLTGLTGLPTLGQSAYFGVGAYTAAVVAKNLTDIGPLQLLLAAGVSALVPCPPGGSPSGPAAWCSSC